MRLSGWLPLLLSLLICSSRLSASQITEVGNARNVDGACKSTSHNDPELGADSRSSSSARSPNGKCIESQADIEVLIQLQTQTNIGHSDNATFLPKKLIVAPKESVNVTTVGPSESDDVLEKAAKEIDEVMKVSLPPSVDAKTEKRWHDHIWKIWESIRRANRHHPTQHREPQQPLSGVREFFESALTFEWFIFTLSIALFVPLQYFLLAKEVSHGLTLLIWLAVGLTYNILIGVRLGIDAGVMWFTGYLLELVFSIENVFVFHVVVRAFRTPEKLTQRAIFTVIICQIVFEMVFFMGLGKPLRTFGLIPYILGVWLIVIGIMAAREEQSEEVELEETVSYRVCRRIFGDRLLKEYDNEQASLFLVKEGVTYVSMLLPAMASLLLVDFLLEVDVTITKIEELQNQYIAFTSSAAAAFALVSLFFVAGDLFQRFKLLQYGVSFVLVFFGAQMLLHHYVVISPLASCTIIILVIFLCIVLSHYDASDTKQTAKASEDES